MKNQNEKNLLNLQQLLLFRQYEQLLNLYPFLNTDIAATLSLLGNTSSINQQPFTSQPVTVEENGLRGEYYDNADFTNLVLTRNDATVNFNWRRGSPDPTIGSNTFSVRWTGSVEPLYSETYTFYTTSDDGVRLKVNGQTIINNFRDQSATEVASTPITLEAGKKYAIELEYYENRGRAVSRLAWSSPSQLKQAIAQSQLYPEIPFPDPNVGDGLWAKYYNNIDFTDLALTRKDARLNFNWRTGSPDPSIASETFSVRWSGQIQALFSEDYTFYTNSDDGIRVKINGETVIDRFIDQPPTEVASVPISLVAGEKYDIVVEYYENRGQAVAQLLWSSASQSKQIIPQSQLFSESAPISSLSATDLTATDEASYTFTVTYSDDTAIDISTLDSNDIRITGVNGFSQLAEFISESPGTDNSRIATYRVNAPGENWLANDNGSYTVSLEPDQVSDTSGNFSPSGILGDFLINIPGTGTGLRGEYYDNINFTDLNLTRIDPTINYDWSIGSPDTSINPDTFSVVWSGQIEAKYSELYTLYSTTDDGVRVFIDDELVIDSFINQPATERSGSIDLEAGQRYNIRIEYYENRGLASAELEWSSATQTREVVPSSQLYPFVLSPVISLGDVPTNVRENEDFVEVEILRTGEDLSQTSTVEYLTSGITADPGDDFTQTSGIATFAPNQTREVVSIPILDDTILDPNETFTFVIDRPENATLGTQRTGKITILDDESTDLIIDDVRVDESAGEVIITVQRGNTENTARVDYTTVTNPADLAEPGNDYQVVSGTLTFTPSQVTETITIPLVDDTIGEVNETFTLQLSNPVGVTLDPEEDSSKITVIDDDFGNISRSLVVDGLTRPTSFDWVPLTGETDENFLLVAQKDGIVRVSRNGELQSEVFIDLSSEVNNTRDRGLLGIAVHPDFDANPYVYLLYTYDPPEVFDNINPNSSLDNPNGNGNRPSRLLRVNAEYIRDTDDNIIGLQAVPDSETVLLGTNSTWEFTSNPDGNSTPIILDRTGNIDFENNFAPSGIVDENGDLFTSMADYYENLDTAVNVQDYLATDSESHSIGYVAFGPDGNLYVSNGDGASYNRVDPRGIRVQDVDNLSGKLLRINPITGEGLADNPFYDGDPDSNRSKVFNLGSRNPFRFTFDDETGKLFIGDVGWKTWEEVNSGEPGSNYGWPFYEGGFDPITNTPQDIRQGEYSPLTYTYTNDQGEVITLRPAQDFYRDFGDSAIAEPVYAYEHFGANAIIMGDFYQGNKLPSAYQGQLFIADSSKSTIDSIKFDDEGNFESIRRFASNVGIPVQITTGPDELLYYVDLVGGAIYNYQVQ
ncbi:MAG: PA14 domain-containing protein [Cyanobacteria bacterium P01_A01_bin.84]